GGAADGGLWAVTAQAHADRLAGFRVGSQFAGAGGLAAVDALGLLVHQLLERAPELLHQRHPLFLATADRVELVLELRGEVVVDVAGEVPAEEVGDRAAHVAGTERAALYFHVLAELQGLDDRGVGRRPADAVLF